MPAALIACSLVFSPPTTSFLKRGTRVECTKLLRWCLETALAAPLASFSIDAGVSAEAHAMLAEFRDRVAWTEVDAADLGLVFVHNVPDGLDGLGKNRDAQGMVCKGLAHDSFPISWGRLRWWVVACWART